ncbi:hypothetical protein Tco_1304059 [Tanacetum coccineum]
MIVTIITPPESSLRPQLTDPIINVPIPTLRADRGKGIARETNNSPPKLVHMEKIEKMEKVTQEARLMKLSKDALIQKNKRVGDLLNSLHEKYERLKKYEVRIVGLKCNRFLLEGVPFVNNMVIEEPEHGIFFIDSFGDESFQRVEPKQIYCSNNICEVFNGKIGGARDKPVITLLEYIKECCMKRIVNVQSVIDKCACPLTPTATRIMESIKNIVMNDREAPPPEAWVSIPKKRRKTSKRENEPFVKDGKLSKRGRIITCQSCGNIGHNKATCKGEGVGVVIGFSVAGGQPGGVGVGVNS